MKLQDVVYSFFPKLGSFNNISCKNKFPFPLQSEILTYQLTSEEKKMLKVIRTYIISHLHHT